MPSYTPLAGVYGSQTMALFGYSFGAAILLHGDFFLWYYVLWKIVADGWEPTAFNEAGEVDA